MAQGGEFAFVLYTAAGGAGILDGDMLAHLNAAVIVSMALTPLLAILADRLARMQQPSLDGVEVADGLTGSVLVIGFGRFGQVAAQALLSRGIDVAIIDSDVEMIQAASRFGFKIYYGDGTRLDVLRAAGATNARLVAVCVEDRAAANRIVELVRSEFPGTRLHVRSYDRGHTLELLARGVEYELRETYESAIAFGRNTLEALGVDPALAREVEEDVRDRDRARLAMQQAEGIYAGTSMLHRQPVPEPLRTPARAAKPLNPEAEDIIRGEPRV
jgi:glutathione-regulated potassium-efflux system protein KefB